MDERHKQELAAEWQQRFEEAQRAAAVYAAGLSDVGRLFVACGRFSFFAGTETQDRVSQGHANQEDIPAFLEVTI